MAFDPAAFVTQVDSALQAKTEPPPVDPAQAGAQSFDPAKFSSDVSRALGDKFYTESAEDLANDSNFNVHDYLADNDLLNDSHSVDKAVQIIKLRQQNPHTLANTMSGVGSIAMDAASLPFQALEAGYLGVKNLISAPSNQQSALDESGLSSNPIATIPAGFIKGAGQTVGNAFGTAGNMMLAEHQQLMADNNPEYAKQLADQQKADAIASATPSPEKIQALQQAVKDNDGQPLSLEQLAQINKQFPQISVDNTNLGKLGANIIAGTKEASGSLSAATTGTEQFGVDVARLPQNAAVSILPGHIFDKSDDQIRSELVNDVKRKQQINAALAGQNTSTHWLPGVTGADEQLDPGLSSTSFEDLSNLDPSITPQGEAKKIGNMSSVEGLQNLLPAAGGAAKALGVTSKVGELGTAAADAATDFMSQSRTGQTILGGVAKVAQGVQKVSDVLDKAGSQLGQISTAVGQKIGDTAVKIGDYVTDPKTARTVGKVVGGITGFIHGGPISAIAGSMIGNVTGRYAAKVTKLGGKVAQWTIPLIQDAATGSVGLMNKAGQFFEPELLGARGGLAYAAPMVFGSETPDDAVNSALGMAAFGALGGGMTRTQTMFYDAALNAGKWGKTMEDPGYQDIGKDKGLDAVTQRGIAGMNPQQIPLFNKLRQLFSGVHDVYALNDNEYEAEQARYETAMNGGKNTFTPGKFGFIDMTDPKNPKAIIRVRGNGDVPALVHEPGHLIWDHVQQHYPDLADEVTNAFLKDTAGQARVEKVMRKTGVIDSTTLQDEADAIVKNEWAAEQFGQALKGTLHGPTGVVGAFAQGLGKFIEDHNVPVSTTSAKVKSPYGLNPSFITNDVFRRYLAGLKANANQPKTPPSSTPPSAVLARPTRPGPNPVPPGTIAAPSTNAAQSGRVQVSPEETKTQTQSDVQHQSDVSHLVEQLNELVSGDLTQTGKKPNPKNVRPEFAQIAHDFHTFGAEPGLTDELRATLDYLKKYDADFAKSAKSLKTIMGQKLEFIESLMDKIDEYNAEREFSRNAAVSEARFKYAPRAVEPAQTLPMARATEKTPNVPLQIPRSLPFSPESAPVIDVHKQPMNIRASDTDPGKANLSEARKLTIPAGLKPAKVSDGMKPGTRRVQVKEGSNTEQVVARDGTKIGVPHPENDLELINSLAKSAKAPITVKSLLLKLPEIIRNRLGLNLHYDSAENSIAKIPDAAARKLAQQLADRGLLPRELAQKNFVPSHVEVLEKAEMDHSAPFDIVVNKLESMLKKVKDKPFKNLEEAKIVAAAVQATLKGGMDLNAMHDVLEKDFGIKLSHEQLEFIAKAFPTKKVQRALLHGFSQDKVIANANLIHEGLEHMEANGKLEDPDLQRLQRFIGSGEWLQTMQDRNENQARGFRGDGAKLSQPTVRGDLIKPEHSTNKAIYGKPIPIEDWKIQALNLIEGGPTQNSFRPEAALNEIDARNGRRNPLFDKLVSAGKDFKVEGEHGDVTGVKNIISPANEALRIDRIDKVNDKNGLPMLPSDSRQRSIGFMSDPSKLNDSLMTKSKELGIIKTKQRMNNEDSETTSDRGTNKPNSNRNATAKGSSVADARSDKQNPDSESGGSSETDRAFEKISSYFGANARTGEAAPEPPIGPKLSEEEKEIDEEVQARKLAKYAKAENLEVPDSKFVKKNFVGKGAEHVVYFDPEDKTRVIKRTKPFGYGIVPVIDGPGISQDIATISDYLNRVRLSNEVFGDGIKFIGTKTVINDAPQFSMLNSHGPSLVISQPFIESMKNSQGKVVTPTHPEINKYLSENKFIAVNRSNFNKGYGCNTWYRLSDGLILTDTHEGNFIKGIDGKIYAIDVPIAKVNKSELANMIRLLEAKRGKGLNQASFDEPNPLKSREEFDKLEEQREIEENKRFNNGL